MKQSKSRIQATNHAADYVPAVQFQTVSFYDPKQQRQVVLMYALGEDGIVREFTGQDWKAFPIAKG